MNEPTNQPEKQDTIRDEKGRWKPGVSGNPSGRPPKEHSISDLIRGLIESNPDKKQQLGEKILDLALAGDPAMIKLVWQYMDGMPTQHVKTEDVNPADSAELSLLREIVANHEKPREPLPAERKTN